MLGERALPRLLLLKAREPSILFNGGIYILLQNKHW